MLPPLTPFGRWLAWVGGLLFTGFNTVSCVAGLWISAYVVQVRGHTLPHDAAMELPSILGLGTINALALAYLCLHRQPRPDASRRG